MDSKELPSILRDDNISEETNKLISSLPSHKDTGGLKLCKYQGCWYSYNTLQGVLNFQSGFHPQDTDIILASYPKSGATWLKALTVALLEKSKNRSTSDPHHPLQYDNPHGIVPCLEMDVYHESSSPHLDKFSATPRLNVKDTLVSWWLFGNAILKTEQTRSDLQSKFESFCNGTIYYGPFWEHLLSYWLRILEDPKHVLFMRRRELTCVRGLGALLSLGNLRSLEVKKTGKRNDVNHKDYGNKGEVGDSKNYLTTEMEKKIDMIIQEKLQGSGLKL
ncbi:BnaC04g54880D [Brassica napus]|uniref:Sulfotransferase n=1 Tax=Brassica napus TaxID=3708 RepID=A0A078J9X5_BRANA|nr:BnaC04g54880D [Brassica napus]